MIAGIAAIPVEIRLGTARAAALFSATANRLHGVRPTRSDRRRAIVRLLEDPEWARWSDQQIASLNELWNIAPAATDDPGRTNEVRLAIGTFYIPVLAALVIGTGVRSDTRPSQMRMQSRR